MKHNKKQETVGNSGRHWLDDVVWVFKCIFNVWILINVLLLVWSKSIIASRQTNEMMDKHFHPISDVTYRLSFGFIFLTFHFLETTFVK